MVAGRIPAELKSEWVDVDFERAAKDVNRRCGCIAETEAQRDKFCRTVNFADTSISVIPESNWREIVDSRQGVTPRVLGVPTKDQNGEGSCFPAGTLIRMANGMQKPIQDVKVLDVVLTAEGRCKRVLKTMVRDATSLCRIRLRGHSHLKATGEHPILTKRGYVTVDNLRLGDEVAIPRYALSSNANVPTTMFITTAEYIPRRTRLNHAQGTRHIGIPGKPAATMVRTTIPDVIHLTPGFGRIVGLFLAEGSTSQQKVTWTFGIHEKDTLVAELVGLLQKEVGAVPSVRVRGNHHTVKVDVYGVTWARFFEGMCATGSRHKRLHPELASGPPEFLREVLEGWLDGDTYREQHGGREGITISHSLAMNMFDIANACGLRPFIRRSEPVMNSAAKTRQPYWVTGYGNQTTKKGWKAPLDKTRMFRPVVGIEKEEFDGPVFNLEVEDDHSYVAEGIGVHNCTSFNTTIEYEYLFTLTYGRQYWIEFSPQSLYQLCGSSSGSGSSLSCNMEKLRTSGLIPADTPANRERFGAMVLKNVGWSQRSNPRPDGWREFAKHFRVNEWVKISTLEEFFTCLLLNKPVSYGRSGHSICGVAPVWRNGWKIMYHNSWGDWGDEGFGYDTFSTRLLGYGCYTPLSIYHPDIEGLHLPPAPNVTVG